MTCKPLASPSNEIGENAACNICGNQVPYSRGLEIRNDLNVVNNNPRVLVLKGFALWKPIVF